MYLFVLFTVKTWNITKERLQQKILLFRSSRSHIFQYFYKTGLFKNFLKLIEKNLQLYRKRDPTQIFSRKFYEIFKNTVSTEALGATVSETSSQAVCLDNDKDIKMASTKATFLTILPTLKMFFVCLDNFGSHYSKQVLKISNIFKESIWGEVQLQLHLCGLH